MVDLSASVSFHAGNTPNRTAIIFGEDRISYADLRYRFCSVAGMLVDHGVKAGDRVAVLMKNSPAFLEIALATSHIGAVFLPINFRLARDEVAYIVGNAEARLVFVDEELQKNAEGLEDAVIVGAAAQRDASRLAPGTAPITQAVTKHVDDLYRLIYTSGTTDHPKGVMHSFSNVAWKAKAHIIALGLSCADRLLLVGPLYHVGAFDLPGLTILALGGTVCVQRAFDPVEVMRAIERERITGVWLAPVMMNAIIDAGDAGRFDLSSLKWCIGGGERSVESRIKQFTTVFPQARFVDAYGLTESCSGDTLMPAGWELEKIGSVGRAVPYVEIEIRDENGERLPVGQEGEICLCGPKITRGYWRNPKKTSESFFGEWFRTGDVGILDDAGFLTVTDRAKDMIISGGENIASSEVERVAYEMPQISEAAVIGLPDPKWGERIVLVAVLKPGQSLDLEALTTFCRKHLAPFKVPKELHLRSSLPRNPSGKVLKRVLREEMSQDLARGGETRSLVSGKDMAKCGESHADA